MKNRHGLLNILFLLPLVILLSSNAYPQAKDLSRDLSITWSSRKEPGPGSVFGSMTNKSANSYPCVRIEFNLSTRFDLRMPGEPGKHLGIFPVEVRNVSPRTVRNFDQPLPYPAGMGVKSVSECQSPPPRPFPSNLKVLSFTITPTTIQEGQTATLQWQTENAEKVILGERNPELSRNPSAEPILMPRTVESSGSLSLAPTRTTTYSLKATKGSFSTFARSVTITVADLPQGFCTVFGRVSNEKSDYATTIGIYRPGDSDRRRVVLTQKVRLNGDYSIPNVPVGEYDVIPRGLYPSDKFNIGPSPRAVRIVCRPARSHRADFTIKSNEG